jgi:hypothetical protein
MPPTFFTVMNICCDQLQKALQYEAMVMPGAQQITENVRVIFRKICCAVANVKRCYRLCKSFRIPETI